MSNRGPGAFNVSLKVLGPLSNERSEALVFFAWMAYWNLGMIVEAEVAMWRSFWRCDDPEIRGALLASWDARESTQLQLDLFGAR